MSQHSLPYAVNCSILFTDLPLLRRPFAAADAGFGAVEFWWPFADAVPTDLEVDQFVTAITDAGVQLVGLNFAAGDMPAGDRGLVSWPGREQEFRANVDVVAGIGGRLGCRAFNALFGNRIDGIDPRVQDDLATQNLAIAASAVSRIEGVVLVEAVSGPQPYPLRTAADAVAVVDRLASAGADNVRFLADIYHLAMNGDDVDAAIATYTNRIGHVQIADAPGRHEPGTGNLDIERYLTDLEAAGYRGWVGLEYSASGADTDVFGWLARQRRGSVPAPIARGGVG